MSMASARRHCPIVPLCLLACAMSSTFAGTAAATAGSGELSGHSGGMNVAICDGSVRLVSSSVSHGLIAGPATIELVEHRQGLHATVNQSPGRVVPFAVALRGVPASGRSADCLADWPEGWNRCRCEIAATADGVAELRVYHPREAGCVLVGRVAEEAL